MITILPDSHRPTPAPHCFGSFQNDWCLTFKMNRFDCYLLWPIDSIRRADGQPLRIDHWSPHTTSYVDPSIQIDSISRFPLPMFENFHDSFEILLLQTLFNWILVWIRFVAPPPPPPQKNGLLSFTHCSSWIWWLTDTLSHTHTYTRTQTQTRTNANTFPLQKIHCKKSTDNDRRAYRLI